MAFLKEEDMSWELKMAVSEYTTALVLKNRELLSMQHNEGVAHTAVSTQYEILHAQVRLLPLEFQRRFRSQVRVQVDRQKAEDMLSAQTNGRYFGTSENYEALYNRLECNSRAMAKWGYDGKYTTEAEVKAEEKRITDVLLDRKMSRSDFDERKCALDAELKRVRAAAFVPLDGSQKPVQARQARHHHQATKQAHQEAVRRLSLWLNDTSHQG